MPTTILVIDDDPLIRQVADLVLTQAGYTVASASTGESGLHMIDHTRAQLVLLDIQMPDMSGLAVLNILRRHRRNKVPVMMLTAKGDVETVKAALSAGANGYMVKPFKADDLIRRVQAALKPPGETPAAPAPPTNVMLD
jgi:DNA-binding response OmpR family regulator